LGIRTQKEEIQGNPWKEQWYYRRVVHQQNGDWAATEIVTQKYHRER
jgi:hypothetical protein